MVQTRHFRFLWLIFIFTFLSTAKAAPADILFEGYSKIMSGNGHAGYAIERYSFDKKLKRWKVSRFLKAKINNQEINEHLTGVSSDSFVPISYSYTMSVSNGATKTIEAQFSNGKMTASVTESNQPPKKISKNIPKGVFLSSFLVYVMGNSPKGIQVDTKYDYQAIAEEDASLEKGKALVSAQEEVNGFKAFKVLNDFKSVQYLFFVSAKGEVIATRSPLQGISTEVVPVPSLATTNFQVSSPILKAIFGEVPTGVKNNVSRKYQDEKKSAQADPPMNIETPVNKDKSENVKPGKGLILKGQAPAPSTSGENKGEKE